MTPTDPLFSIQWHFPLIGNIEAIWADYSGSGVTVGVYDDGVEAGHEDLAPNYDASLHLVDDLGNPLPPVPLSAFDGHGTAVAGIIGAANNGIGGVGVAWGVTLAGVNIDFDETGLYGSINAPDPTEFLDLVRQGAKFDIVSNSWGSTPLYQAYQSLATYSFDAVVEQAYGDISASGRGGLGTIVVKSAGNNNRDSNGAGLNASRFTITVAATEADGMAAWYSNFGSSILVTAPAAAVTTDLSDSVVNPLVFVDVGFNSAAAFADINGDGHIDAVLGNEDGVLLTYLGDGAGGFTQLIGAVNPFDGVDVGEFSVPAFVDLDDDGIMDLVVGADDGTLRSFANNGAGVFTELLDAANPFNGVNFGPGAAPTFGDIDGDGDIDAIIGNADGTLRTLLNNGAGVLTEAVGVANPFDGVDIGDYSAPALGDIDGDGDLDIVIGGFDGQLRTFTNNGLGVFTELTGASNPFDGVVFSSFSIPSFADIDSDGDMDLFVGFEFGRFVAFMNDGTGSFSGASGYSDGEYTNRFNGT